MALRSSMPQGAYFQSECYSLPNTSWSLTGYSRARERTGFWIPELRLMLDAGVDLPSDSGARPSAVLITHGHRDHMNALPMLVGHGDTNDLPLHIVAPAAILHRLEQYTQLARAVKVDNSDGLPEKYRLPSEENRLELLTYCQDAKRNVPFFVPNNDYKKWIGVKANQSLTLCVGKKFNTRISIKTLHLFHGLCTSIGFLISEPSKSIQKLRPELLGATPKETAQKIQAARLRGDDSHTTYEMPEAPKFAYVLDTTVEALNVNQSPTAKMLLTCPTIMIECTFLEDSKQKDAESRGHVWWGGLLPFVRSCRKMDAPNKSWILTHFSLRYKEQDIIAFFQDPQLSKIVLEERDDVQPSNPDLVLWLDSGPFEIWIKQFLW